MTVPQETGVGEIARVLLRPFAGVSADGDDALETELLSRGLVMARKSPRCPTCAAPGSSHERYARDLEERTHDIAITGRVLKSQEPYLIDQQSACEWFKVSDQTLRSYARLGMPVHGPHQRLL